MTVPGTGYRSLMGRGPLRAPATRSGEVGPVRRARRDWVADALVFLLAFGVAGAAVLDSVARHVPAVPFAVDLVLGLLSCFAMWLRRRWPVAVAVIVGLAAVYATTAAGTALIALFTVAMYRRFAVVGPIAAGYLVAAALTPLVRRDLHGAYGAQVLLGLVCVVAALAWGMFVRARRLLVSSLRERALRAEAEQELRVAEAQRAERDRIAREMHDVLAHRISLLSLHAGALELHPAAPAAEIAETAGVMRESAHRALEDLREVIGVLRADRAGGDPADEAPQRPQPTLADLATLVDESRRAGMRVVLECQVDDLAAVPGTAGRAGYRIVQEGLTNARKHAPGTEVSVTVRGQAGEGLDIELCNPCPAPAAGTRSMPGAGTGLIGLAERASLAGGRLDHGRTPTGDFRLRAWLPWPP